MLGHFGGFAADAVLGGENLQIPKNAFTSSSDPYDVFYCLNLWLTPVTVTSDTYAVNHYRGPEYLQVRLRIQPQVVFRSLHIDGQVIQAPDPDIIALHAACARIAHMSGAA
ncbi:hypothetical protein EVJ58_g9119 [Rhodofomes roseus]|uniref:Uncharacterized protein n=1 Tax=Rhodofomes roseus TaxID=34475 RepID=A0A4Y9XV40_9APHY|nr:hypothetical protein EVJ58_g9119 [Rhodofomes roseus]